MIMKRIDSDDRDDFEAVPDFFAAGTLSPPLSRLILAPLATCIAEFLRIETQSNCDWTEDKLAPSWPAQSG